ncbi:MAG TPA: tRNA (adenosine(37)-N6)-dimethylallyltransferase MiaA [Candidatus Binatia bacterium]|nr:tRNA (adenosine(37)-N6)-dimethylallyltransferase MiaA [Candidatus Binatia bacterium]
MTPAPILAVVGPTGVGKSALALELAEQLDAEIVNADSRQVYRHLDIGSAKPSASDRARVPHHVFDVVDPDQPFDGARYRDLALAAITDIRQRGKHVLVVGGTGLYIKALRYGLFPGPPRDVALRRHLEAEEIAAPGLLHRRVSEVDPATAARLHPHDHARLIRALEVHQLTGRPISAWQREHGFRAPTVPITVIGLTLERSELRARIAARCRAMVDAGLIEEVRTLWARGYPRTLPILQTIGYREMGAVAAGEAPLDDALAAMTQATCQLAKRQLTWFRADPSVQWISALAAPITAIHSLLVA